MTRSSCGSRPHGFTLLELLVATVMFAALVGVMHSMLFGALRLRNASFRAVEQALPREQLAQIFRRDFKGMVAPSGVLAGPVVATSEEVQNARHDSITFFTTTGVIGETDPWGEIQEVEYRLEEPDDRDPDLGLDLIREPRRNLLPAIEEEVEDLAPHRLMRGVRSLQLLYWDGEEWTDSWDSTAVENENPDAVWLRIEFVNGNPDLQPENPLEVVCQITTQPRPTPTGATPSGGSGSSNPTPTPTPAPTPPGQGGGR